MYDGIVCKCLSNKSCLTKIQLKYIKEIKNVNVLDETNSIPAFAI